MYTVTTPTLPIVWLAVGLAINWVQVFFIAVGFFFSSDGPELTCPNTYTALEYEPNKLTCTVEGYPKPEIVWYRDGDEVELPENFTRGSGGQYVITASNSLASVNVTVELNILCKLFP